MSATPPPNENQQICPIGVIGTGVMGASLARNLARNLEAPVAVFDLDEARVRNLVEYYPGESLVGFSDLKQFTNALSDPRVILLMVPAGRPVDAVLESLEPLLDEGDIVIDGGNTHYLDTDRRVKWCGDRGIRFIGMGISGGEQGALLGPSMMPGGDPSVWEPISPLLEPIAAKAPDGTPCVALVGSGASGHFTKIVHNGIEYADLQLLAESYALLRARGMSPGEVAEEFSKWNKGKSASYLLESATAVLTATDPDTGEPLIDYVLDEAKGKGTGAWTVIAGAEEGVSVNVVAEAFFARSASSSRKERAAWVGTNVLGAPGEVDASTDQIRDAYLLARLISYQQGLNLLMEASKENGWNIDLANVVSLWRAGCIIRAGFLEDIMTIYKDSPTEPSVLTVYPFLSQVKERINPLREVVASASLAGIPIPALAAALNYQQMMITPSLPTALVQLQRDNFGSHTYERTDKPGNFHIVWEGDLQQVES